MTNLEHGDWVVGADGLKVWKGKVSWDDVFGGATVHYTLGEPTSVEGALLPDGSPAGFVKTLDPLNGSIWRRADGRGGYLIGRVSISPEGVTFTDDPVLDAEMKADPAETAGNAMERDLAMDPEFMKRIQDDAFADEVYGSFCNREWRRADGERFAISWRTSGGMVAGFRRRGESYLDWYPFSEQGNEGLLAEVEGIYRRLGWAEITRAEEIGDFRAAERLLDEIEARSVGQAREKAVYRPEGIDDRTDAFARAYRAMESGRATEEEYRWIVARVLAPPPPAEGVALKP